MARERAIAQAADRITGELLEAHKVFKTAKEGAVLRSRYNDDLLLPVCCECDQSLQISKSTYDRHYFKHYSNSANCLLKLDGLSRKETERINAILVAKESPRHKYLKQKIVELLLATDGVQTDSVFIDDRYIYHGDEKRRPDVYCRYRDKEIVFEFQLSVLSLRYIQSRHHFYKAKGIYLVWILDNFDVHGQSSMEKDIKYLTAFQNFFKLDETGLVFRLSCTYKKPVLSGRTIITPWQTRSINFEEIQFCSETIQIYYHNYEQHLLLARQAQAALPPLPPVKYDHYEDPEEEYYAAMDDIWEQQSLEKANALCDTIARCRKQGGLMYQTEKMLKDFNEFDIETLNEKLGFDMKYHKGKPIFNYYLATAKLDHYPFLVFLLEETRIRLEVNACDDLGTTVFQEIYLNPDLSSRPALVSRIFERDYQLKPEDLNWFEQQGTVKNRSELVILYQMYQRLRTRPNIHLIDLNVKLFYILESARLQRIVGYNFQNWIGFANNAISAYKEFWQYIEAAFRTYGVWEKVIQEDRRGSFNAKLINYRDELPEQDTSLELIISELFPEVPLPKKTVHYIF